MDLLNLDFVQVLLSDKGKADLAQYLIIVSIVWMSMGRKVSARFKDLTEEVRKLATASEARLLKIEDAMLDGSGRFVKIERDVGELTTRVDSLEKQKGVKNVSNH